MPKKSPDIDQEPPRRLRDRMPAPRKILLIGALVAAAGGAAAVGTGKKDRAADDRGATAALRASALSHAKEASINIKLTCNPKAPELSSDDIRDIDRQLGHIDEKAIASGAAADAFQDERRAVVEVALQEHGLLNPVKAEIMAADAAVDAATYQYAGSDEGPTPAEIFETNYEPAVAALAIDDASQELAAARENLEGIITASGATLPVESALVRPPDFELGLGEEDPFAAFAAAQHEAETAVCYSPGDDPSKYTP